MKTTLFRSISFLIVFAVATSACRQQTKIVQPNEIANSELEGNRRLWQKSKIENYNFEIFKTQGGTWAWVPMLIRVRNNATISMEPVREPGEFLKTEGYEGFDRVEKILDQIQEAHSKGYRVEVTYNKEYGYPEKTIIDSMEHNHSAFGIEVSKFEIIKTD